MRRRILYILLIAFWLLSSSRAAYAFDYEQASQPASWSTKTTFSDDVQPSCSFRSTSSYTPIVGSTSYLSDGSGEVGAPPRNIRRGWGAPTDEDDPIGSITTTPIGEPLVLLLMALVYIFVLSRRTKTPSTEEDRK